eukprot:2579265-Rhodomonas_salina.1
MSDAGADAVFAELQRARDMLNQAEYAIRVRHTRHPNVYCTAALAETLHCVQSLANNLHALVHEHDARAAG